MERWEALDRYVRDAMASWHCPGVALAVVRGDDVLHRAAHGMGDVEAGRPMTHDTRFPMASVTKSVTAMSAALLVDEGKLGWDTPVRTYLPELVLHDPYATEHLTVRDMLSHRSGMPRHDLAAWRLDLPRATFVKRLRHLRFSASFRARFQYNNLMYYTAAHLVERVAEQRWEEFVQARIFEPLGMTGSSFVPEPPRAGAATARGYRIERDAGGAPTGLVPTPLGAHTELSPGAAGALFSTLDDMIRWLGVQVNRGRWGDARLVSSGTCDQMHLPTTVVPGGGYKDALMGHPMYAYGMGWFVEPYRGHTLVQHGGNVEGHSLMIGFLPVERLGVVVLTNAAAMPLRDALLYEAIDRALGLPGRDWSARFHGVFDEAFRATERGKATSAQERIEDAPASHPLDDYVGHFQADGYPAFAVRRAGDGLLARLVDSLDWSELRHHHFDVFEWRLVDFDERMKVRFLANDQGEIDAIAVPIEPEVDDVVFRRRPLELDDATLAAIVGEYATPIEGVAIAITAQGRRVYAAASGEPAEEIHPYRSAADRVAFRRKRDRLEFVRDDGAFTRLVIKEPGMTLEARRRG